MNTTFFVTGIGTDVGKTIASAILVEALQADYYKPIQAGDLDHSDTHKVKALISNTTSVFHPSQYRLKTPMSPHAAAAIDSITIDSNKIQIPETTNQLVVEGAGGLLVPINDSQTILDLILPEFHVIVVSRHYLGSINHTLLTLQLLKEKGYKTSLLFNGTEHPTTEDIIKKMSDVHILGRIDEEPYVDQNVVKEYALRFKEELFKL